MDATILVTNPIVLDPGNFTQLSKTPWAGNKIWQKYKRSLISRQENERIGESWEFSCDPHMPSHLLNHPNITLFALIDQCPREILSKALHDRQKSAHAHILLKLLDAAQPLSFQVHPSDNDPNLKQNECGKPESWLILEAEEGAGIYLGFKPGVTKSNLRELLKRGSDVERCFQFIPVKSNDYFDLAPGTAHAIGPGVTLLEPQRINRGQSGKTYRLWDWDRKYAPTGELDSLGGMPRELHIEESLPLLDPLSQSGEHFLNSLKKSPDVQQICDNATLFSFPANQDYRTDRLKMTDACAVELAVDQGYGVVFMVSGELNFKGAGGINISAKCGQTTLLPHASFPIIFKSLAPCDVVLITPATANNSWK